MLPIHDILSQIILQFRTNGTLVLQAPPGAGKTTVVPLAFLKEPWAEQGKIILLEPRRIAARAAARYMAKTLGEQVGETVGYRVKMDHKVSAKTRIEVVTEGVLTRMIQSDPELSGVAMVIFDEFHERSLEADFGLALTLDIKGALRPDLKILVMSATLDGEKIAALLECEILTSQGRSYPVDFHYRPLKPTSAGRNSSYNSARQLESHMVDVICEALENHSGSILAFLPGAGEISRVEQALKSRKLGGDVLIAPLFGMMQGAAQDQAIKPAPQGKRKITLSTAIAQTSLTIEDITIVIDSGLSRIAAYDPSSGMTALMTKKVTKSSAEQRAGRAGRVQAGVCYRLWSEAAHTGLETFDPIQIKQADLAPLVLELAAWGVANPADLQWLDLPDAAHFDQARDLLQDLKALDIQGRITDHGKEMAKMPLHPRLSHMVIKAAEIGQFELGLMIAALLSEKDIMQLKRGHSSVDMTIRVKALLAVKQGKIPAACDIGGAKRIGAQLKVWHRIFGRKAQAGAIDLSLSGVVIGFAYPDRIAQRRDGVGQNRQVAYILSGGKGASLEAADELCKEEFMAVAYLQKSSARGGVNARVFLSAPLSRDQIEEYFEDSITEETFIRWDKRLSSLTSRQQSRLGKVVLRDRPLKDPDPEEAVKAMIEGIRQMGLQVLPWENRHKGKVITKKALTLKKRVSFLYDNLQEGGGLEAVKSEGDILNHIPDMRDEALLATLEEWLAPYLTGIDSKSALQGLNMADIIQNLLGWQGGQMLDDWLPSHIKVPTGSNIPIDYTVHPPVLAVRLQELFGCSETPSIMAGRLKLVIHLLSPARRPLQVTQDLDYFWHNSYDAIKKEMRGRYPKHFWPDNPAEAIPTSRIKNKKN